MDSQMCECWICVDNDGDYAFGSGAAEACEKYEEEFQPLSDSSGFRIVKVTVTVPLPKIIELHGTVTIEEKASVLAEVQK